MTLVSEDSEKIRAHMMALVSLSTGSGTYSRLMTKLGKKTFFCEFWNFGCTDFVKKTCIGYEDNLIDGIFNLHVQGAKFGRKKDKFGGQSFFKV